MLPNWIGIGAGRSGTTSLHAILRQHSLIFSPRAKELNFFTRPDIDESALSLYEYHHFADWSGEPSVGEFTPAYLITPEAAQSIRDILGPDTKIVVIFRQPAERAFSHYSQHAQGFIEFRSFERAIEDEVTGVDDDEPYYRVGLYAQHLNEYLKIFGEANVFPLIYEEDLFGRFDAAMAELQDFLAVDHEDLSNQHSNQLKGYSLNVERGPEQDERLVRCQNMRPYTQGAVRTIRKPSRSTLNRVYQHQSLVTRHKPFRFLQQMTESLYAGEIERLESMIGRDLSAWKSCDAVWGQT